MHYIAKYIVRYPPRWLLSALRQLDGGFVWASLGVAIMSLNIPLRVKEVARCQPDGHQDHHVCQVTPDLGPDPPTQLQIPQPSQSCLDIQ